MDREAEHTQLKEKDLNNLSLLDMLGYQNMDPVHLRRIFVLLLREIYSVPENLENPELKNPAIIYSEKETERTLDIDLDFLYDPERVAARPGIYVGLGPINFEKKVIGDDAGLSEDNSTRYYECMSNVALNIRHISTAPDFSYLLATQTLMALLSARNLLFSNLSGLAAMEPKQVAQIQLSDPEPEKEFRVDVVFNISFMFSWTTKLEGHRLKSIDPVFEPTSGVKGMTGYDCPSH
jgi:hypothetical protein